MSQPEIFVHDPTANPAPLGLMGFGLTTLLLNIHNAGYIGAELDDPRDGGSSTAASRR